VDLGFAANRGMLEAMWRQEVFQGRAGEFHQRELGVALEPTLWWFEIDSPALVLGSSQPIGHIDLAACTREGIEVVRRRSGGGAVLMRPGESSWVDVLLPRTHPWWEDDVRRSALWLGEAWSRALESLGVEGTTVHRGEMVRSPWSSHVCFAGVAAGEVVLDDRKVVGISQRRTRAGARFQCIVYRMWDPAAHARLFSPPAPTAEELRHLAVPVEHERPALAVAVAEALNVG
jgi:lipoate-protein ligase A